tara:strand:+ start:107 stop:415 length:309 start_codon:yes stop_codon:yes gene_type:complete
MFEILKELKDAEQQAKDLVIDANKNSEQSLKKAQEKGIFNLKNLEGVFDRQKESALQETKTELEKEIKDIEKQGEQEISDLQKKAKSIKTATIKEIKKIILE